MAAGTGKLTRALVAAGAACVAAEPSASMRAAFARAVPGVAQVGADAEHLPFADGSFDAVTVAQAFHWFATAEALAEFARVLRPGGGLALIWNERDESDPWWPSSTRISKWDVHQPYPVGRDFGAVVDGAGRFGPVDPDPVPLHPAARPDGLRGAGGLAQLHRGARPRTGAGRSSTRSPRWPAGCAEPIALPYLADLFCARVR